MSLGEGKDGALLSRSGCGASGELRGVRERRRHGNLEPRSSRPRLTGADASLARWVNGAASASHRASIIGAVVGTRRGGRRTRARSVARGGDRRLACGRISPRGENGASAGATTRSVAAALAADDHRAAIAPIIVARGRPANGRWRRNPIGAVLEVGQNTGPAPALRRRRGGGSLQFTKRDIRHLAIVVHLHGAGRKIDRDDLNSRFLLAFAQLPGSRRLVRPRFGQYEQGNLPTHQVGHAGESHRHRRRGGRGRRRLIGRWSRLRQSKGIPDRNELVRVFRGSGRRRLGRGRCGGVGRLRRRRISGLLGHRCAEWDRRHSDPKNGTPKARCQPFSHVRGITFHNTRGNTNRNPRLRRARKTPRSLRRRPGIIQTTIGGIAKPIRPQAGAQPNAASTQEARDPPRLGSNNADFRPAAFAPSTSSPGLSPT